MRRVGGVLVVLLASTGASRADPAPSATAPACTVAGEVLLDGRPVAATVEVRLRIENPRFPHGFHWTSLAVERALLAPDLAAAPKATARSGSDGRFELVGLTPGRYEVSARDEAGDWASAHVPLHVAGQRARVTLDLLRGTERLAGRLVHGDGSPFRGFVAASRGRLVGPDEEDVRPASVRWTATDAEGRFALEGLPRGAVTLTALEPGRLRQPLGTVDLPSPRAFDAAVDAVAEPVRGRVVDVESDRPVEGATVVWSDYTRDGMVGGAVTTGADGAYVLPSPVPLYSLHIVRHGYAPLYLQDLAGVGRGTVRIRRGVRVTGRVVTADGRSPGAGVAVERRGAGSYWYQWTHAETDAEGRFTLEDQAPGDGWVFARGLGWVPQGLVARGPFASREDLPRADPFSWTVEPDRPLDVTLAVERGAAIVGRVLDADGRPVGGVPVVVEESDDPEYSWEGHGVPPVAASGTDGGFRVDGLLRGAAYKLSLRPAGEAPIEVEATARAPEDGGEPEAVRLPAPHWILVRVVDAKTRRPVAGARVELMLARRDDRVWRTDEAGLARVGPLGPVRGDVDVTAPGYVDANQRAVPQATREGAEATIPLTPALSIEGRVVGADGKPAPEAIVYVAETSQDVWKTYRGKKACDEEGRFVAEGVQDIDYRVAAVLWKGTERFEATALVHGGARDVVLTLRPAPKPVPEPAPSIGPAEERPPAARLRVVDPDGRPVARAKVRGVDAREGVVDGEALLDRAPPPDAAIVIEHATAEDGVPLPLGPLRLAGWPKGPGDPPVVVLPPERVLEGRVVDPDGAPAPRVVVRAVDEDDEDSVDPHGTGHGPVAGAGVSRGDGTFRIGGLEDRPYAVEVVTPEGLLPPKEAPRARPGVALDLRLRRTVAAVVVVTAPGGGPAADVRLSAKRDAWSYFWRTGWTRESLVAASGSTDAQGRVVLRGLDPDLEHALSIEPPERRKDWFPESRDDWRPADLTVTLRPRGVVRGRIVVPKGEPPDWTYVHWRQGGPWTAQSVQGSGFSIAIPATGEVELYAAPSGLRRPLPTTRIAKARTEGEEVRLEYDRGAVLRARPKGPSGQETPTVTWALVEEAMGPGEGNVIQGPRPRKAPPEGVEFEGLDPAARYTIFAVGGKGGLCARIAGVAPRAEPVEVALGPGAVISGKVVASGRLLEAGVTARPVGGGPEVEAEVDAANAFRLEGLTPGRWRVRAHAIMGPLDVGAEVEADAGGTVDLHLVPR